MRIVIVGAGLAGLAAGTKLRNNGHDVTIYEASKRAGGRASTYHRIGTDDLVDVGTQYFHSNYKRALSLIKDTDLKSELKKIKGKTRFFDDRHPEGSFRTGHKMPYIASGSIIANLKMVISGAVKMLKHQIDPFAVNSKSKADILSADEIVSDPFEWEFSARALISAGTLVEPNPGDISYLHLIRLMRIIVMTDYLTLDRGISSLHVELAGGLDVRYEEPVTSLVTTNDVVEGVKFKSGEMVQSDHVLIATSPKHAAELLPRNWVEEAEFLTQIRQPAAIIVTLFLDCELEKNTWSYVFRSDANKLVSFCVDAAQKNPRMVPSGKAVLQAWICAPSSEKTIGDLDKEIEQKVIFELEQYFPNLKEKVEHAHVHKVENAVPQTPVGHASRAQNFLDLMDNHAGIEMCGDYLSGGYMECALWSVDRAIKNMKDR